MAEQNAASPDYKTPYKFTGKELDEETGLYYYGARYYDPSIGLFMSVDPLADKYPGWNPYNYTLNNPVRFIDPDGRFSLDPISAKNNPELVKYLKGMVKKWNNSSDEFKNGFMKTSGLNNAEVIEMLKYGSGPLLTVKNLDKDTDGDGKEDRFVNGVTYSRKNKKGESYNSNSGKGKIAIDDDVVGIFKTSMKSGDDVIGKLGETMLESTLFHEGAHYGNIKKNKNPNGTFKESGKAFEKKVYGTDIGRGLINRRIKSISKTGTIPKISIKPIEL